MFWPTSRLSNLFRVVVITMFLGVLVAGLDMLPASAEQPTTVADEINRSGVFVAPGRRSEVDYQALVAVVQEASRDGITLGIVVPFEPIPDNKSFALRVRQAADVDALISIDPVGVVHVDTSDDYSGSEVRALAAARGATGTADEVALVFLQELRTTPERSAPALVSTIVRAVTYLVLALVLAVVAEHIYRAVRRNSRAAQRT